MRRERKPRRRWKWAIEQGEVAGRVEMVTRTIQPLSKAVTSVENVARWFRAPFFNITIVASLLLLIFDSLRNVGVSRNRSD